MSKLARLLTVPALLSGVVFSFGCGPDPVLCTANCPDLSGTYAVTFSRGGGQCDFTPYFVGSEVAITQAGARVSSALQDPVTLRDQTMTGEIYLPTEKDPPGTLGSFSMNAQVTRLASSESTQVVTLRIIYSGSVQQEGTTRTLAGSLTTSNASGTEPCTVTITYSATGQDTTGGGGG